MNPKQAHLFITVTGFFSIVHANLTQPTFTLCIFNNYPTVQSTFIQFWLELYSFYFQFAYHHNIAEILLRLMLNTNQSIEFT